MSTSLTINDECAQAPAPNICTLIQSVQSEKERARVEREKRVQEKIAEAHAAAREQLAALYDELKPLVVNSFYDTNRDGEVSYLRYEFDEAKLAALELAPFQIYITQQSVYGGQFEPNRTEWRIEFREVVRTGFTSNTRPVNQAAEFFHAIHQRVLDARESERQAKIKEWKLRVDPDDYHRARNPSDADTALAALIELDPHNAERYRAQHARLIAKFEQERAHAEYEARKKAEYEADEKRRAAAYVERAKQYQAAYQEFWNQCLARRQHNVDVWQKYQSELDAQTFDVWKLEYGIIAEEDGGDRMIETETAYLLHGYNMNDWGEYQVLQKGGEIVLRAFRHEVSKDAPQPWKPSEHRAYARILEEMDVKLYASPAHPYPAEILQRFRAEWKIENVLKAPALPEGLDEENDGYLGDTYLYGARALRFAVEEATPLPRFNKQKQEWYD